jgi:hypothetical protein
LKYLSVMCPAPLGFSASAIVPSFLHLAARRESTRRYMSGTSAAAAKKTAETSAETGSTLHGVVALNKHTVSSSSSVFNYRWSYSVL